ncbi:uncharacterized protein LOC110709236 [Chenopodium quinoa]|uniref:uncharacterized protein LOC110709236 n=1 Tax=Chenopodium quinoa TaxID=63459 RepID=UPI000B7770A0|nr:uncharacterized protein LOC110709236 [Chenopodium quinoa]
MAERLRGRGSTKEPKDTVMAFWVDAKSKSKFVDNSDKLCNHYNREGHDEVGCFQLIGYPEWWGNRGRGKSGRGRGGGCGSGGRGSRNSSSGSAPSSSSSQQSSVRASKVAGGSTKQQQGGASTSDDAAGLVGISATQIQKILDILNPTNKSLHGPADEEGDWCG